MRKKSTLAAILSLLMVLVMAVSMTGCVSRNQNDKTDSGKDAALGDEIHHNACQDHKNCQHKEEHGFHPFSLLPFPYETAFLFMAQV